MSHQEKKEDGDHIRDKNTPNTSKQWNTERRHSSNNAFKAADSLSTSLSKTCSLTPVQECSTTADTVCTSTQGGNSDSSFLVNYVANNLDDGRSENKLRSQSVTSSIQKDPSKACANFYKLATSELDSSEELAVLTVTEAAGVGVSNNKGHLQHCANQRQTAEDKTKKIIKKLPKTRDWQGSKVDNEGSGLLPCGLGWQSTKHTVKERLEHMCLNTYLADVYFIVPSVDGNAKERIPAHKFILSIGSPVFDAMFKFDDNQQEAGYGKEANQLKGHAQEIELVDVERKALEALLTFLYTDEVTISSDGVMAVLYTAKKYGVPALEQQCVDFLKDNLNSENAFMLLGQARLFDEPQLIEMCLVIIDRDTNEAIQAEGFSDVDHSTLCSVLKRDSLRIDELPLFQALVRWSLEECTRKDLPITLANQRKVLGCILSLVRYNQMSIQEFAEHVAMSGLLTDSEIVSIFLYFTLNNVGAVSHSLPIHFPVAPRRRFIGKEMSINRFQRIEASWGYSGTPDRIKFTVDAPIFVLGFGLYGSMNDSAEYSVTMEIINFGSGQILAHHETSFMADGTASIFRVMFKEPVEIASALTYIASAKLKGAESHYGTKGLRRIVRQLAPAPSGLSSGNGGYLTDSAITFQFSYAAGNNNGTSVDDGQIPEIVFCQKF